MLMNGMSAGEAQTRPSRCPGMQYDLEKEKRWMKVLRQDQPAGMLLGADSDAAGEKRWCGAPEVIKSR